MYVCVRERERECVYVCVCVCMCVLCGPILAPTTANIATFILNKHRFFQRSLFTFDIAMGCGCDVKFVFVCWP